MVECNHDGIGEEVASLPLIKGIVMENIQPEQPTTMEEIEKELHTNSILYEAARQTAIEAISRSNGVKNAST